MSILMLPVTRTALGDNAERCISRSLFMHRYADPTLAKEDRVGWFNKVKAKEASPAKINAGVPWLPAGAQQLKAQLMARLMVNMAGSVMENAGLCLDRYGIPYIPGAAVKGSARRMALQALHDWCATSTQPHRENLCTHSYAGFASPAAMLEAIALVFGWVQQDWSTEKNQDKHGNDTTWKSDLAWACSSSDEALLEEVWNTATNSLCQRFKVTKTDSTKPWKLLPNFAGSIAFLSAFPNADPGLELDVVTCHHPDYYGQKKEPDGQLKMPVALDIEPPIPVTFLAVKQQPEVQYFTFPVLPLRGADDGLVTRAKAWLASGLENFGIGAKTGAGYGWFHVPELAEWHGARDKEMTKPEALQQAADHAVHQFIKPPAKPGEGTRAPLAESNPSDVDQIISKWRGHVASGNFCLLRKDLAAVDKDDDLRTIMLALIPASEMAPHKLRKSQPFWQSFNNVEGPGILKRCGITLR